MYWKLVTSKAKSDKSLSNGDDCEGGYSTAM